MPSDATIIVEGLTKEYTGKRVVDSLTLSVSKGQVLGFLGPNGAGKTTTLRMLTTVIKPTSGTARIGGFSILSHPLEVRKHIAVIPQASVLGLHLDVYENIRLYLMFHGFGSREAKRRTETAIETFGLKGLAKRRADKLSGGQRRRIQVARALMAGREILFLDEPTTGLDPVMRREAWEHIRRASKQGVTVFLTTHSMEEAEALCTSVALIFGGKLAAHEDVEALKRALGTTKLNITIRGLDKDESTRLVNQWRQLPGIVEISEVFPELQLTLGDGGVPVSALIESVYASGGHTAVIDVRPPTLEQVYLSLIERNKVLGLGV